MQPGLEAAVGTAEPHAAQQPATQPAGGQFATHALQPATTASGPVPAQLPAPQPAAASRPALHTPQQALTATTAAQPSTHSAVGLSAAASKPVTAFLGVSWSHRERRWLAQIHIARYGELFLGLHRDAEAAAVAHDAAAYLAYGR